MKALETIPTINSSDELPHPPNDSEPIEGLAILTGYRCGRCAKLSQNLKWMETHIRQEHKLHGSGQSNLSWSKVALQQWRRGSMLNIGQ
jgi:Orsellinic acid/F9775 biosynthesis cluster protein D